MQFSDLAAGACLILCSSQPCGACSVVTRFFALGVDASGMMQTSKDEVCREYIDFTRLGGYRNNVMERISVVRRAAHGVVGTNGVSDFAYKPAPGFTGEDQFTIRIEGTAMNQPAASNFVYQVTVK